MDSDKQFNWFARSRSQKIVDRSRMKKGTGFVHHNVINFAANKYCDAQRKCSFWASKQFIQSRKCKFQVWLCRWNSWSNIAIRTSSEVHKLTYKLNHVLSHTNAC